MPPTRSGRLLALAAIAFLSCSAAGAQENIDAGKSAQKLFAETCAACHRSPRGLSKGRFSFTLYLYLQKHYASNSSSAWALTSYLESVDAAKRAPTRAAAASPSPPSSTQSPRAASAGPAPSTWSPRSALRPPASIPNR
jgi:mono/diheme cytochrome c family protein